MSSVDGIKLDVSGLVRLIETSDGKASALIRKFAFKIEGDAKMLAPVDTGALRNSGYTEMVDPLNAIIGFLVEYAIFQEFGTSKMPAHPYLTPAIEANRADFLAAWKELFE